MKKIVKIIIFLLIFNLFFVVNVEANEKEFLYLGGDSIGIKMNTGVYIAGKYQVQTDRGKVSPWKHSNIEIGDMILKINDYNIDTNEVLQTYLSNNKISTAELTINRNNQILKTNIDVVTNSLNEQTLGLYIRDKIFGIGTLTFVTKDLYFASLGHGIYDNNVLLSSFGGNLYYSNVSSIKKAEPGIAGEKRAAIDDVTIGKIINNDVTGLYGKLNIRNLKLNKIAIGNQNDIKIGKAKIYTCLEKNNVKSYDIEIVENYIQNNSNIKGIKIKVTDKDLINQTGGIIQGMSGSPIVQNDKIVGAVSHVTVENPTYGYGMHIEWMIKKTEEIV